MSGIRSMTGFATAQGQTPLGFMTVELRGVNSRFLDLTLRLCEELRATEPAVREVISAAVKRGKLECRASLKQAETSGAGINAAALANVLTLQQEVLKVNPDAAPMSVSEILQMPGILNSPEVDQDELNASVATILRDALQAFNASREREGAALAAVLSKTATPSKKWYKRWPNAFPTFTAISRKNSNSAFRKHWVPRFRTRAQSVRKKCRIAFVRK